MDSSVTPRKSYARLVLRYYFKEALRHPWFLTITIIGIVATQTTEVILPVLLRNFFNLIASYNPNPESVHLILVTLGWIATTQIAGAITFRIYIVSLSYLEARAMSHLFSQAFDYLLGHSYHFFVSRFAGTLTRRVSKYAYAFETVFDNFMMEFVPTALFMIGVAFVLFLRNHTLSYIFIGWTIGFLVFQFYVARKLQPFRARRADEDSKVTGSLADGISNQTNVALFSGRRHEYIRFAEVVERWRKALTLAWNLDSAIWAACGFLMIGINIALLYGAIRYWELGRLTVGDFVLIQTFLLGAFNRLFNINHQLRRFYDAMADAEEMAEILSLPHEVRDVSYAKPLVVTESAIAFKDVDFYFHETRPILKNLNLFIKGGEKLALVGPSGAGKTTITKLLLRLYDIGDGAIEIDGQSISKVTQESLRNAISFVPQEPVLFHRSLMENIRYGRRTATDEEVIEAAKKAHCHEFIAKLPEGYGTFVGERGVKLSGGERQRVAIARAILKNAPILVLDEATSSLDSESESLIQDALTVLMENKTVIVIAHRLSTIIKMDRIVVLENGRIVAEGKHEELIAQGGLYQKLWSIQAGGFIHDEDEQEKKEPVDLEE